MSKATILRGNQQEAVDTYYDFLSENDSSIFLLEGVPGGGKSWLIPELIKTHQNYLNVLSGGTLTVETAVTSTLRSSLPHLSSSTGLAARTIHSLLGFIIIEDDYKEKRLVCRNRAKAIETLSKFDIIVIDEITQLPAVIVNLLKNFILNDNVKTKFLFIGDQYQLCASAPPSYQSISYKYKAHLDSSQRSDKSGIANYVKNLRKFIKLNKSFNRIPFREDSPGIKLYHSEDEFYKAFCTFSKTNQTLGLTYHNVAKSNFIKSINEIQFNNPIFKVNDLINVKDEKNRTFGFIVTNIKEDSTFTCDGIPYYELQAGELSLRMPYDLDRVKKQLNKFKRLGDLVNFNRLHNFFSQSIIIVDSQVSTVHSCQGRTIEHVFINMNDIRGCRNNGMKLRLALTSISRASECAHILIKQRKK